MSAVITVILYNVFWARYKQKREASKDASQSTSYVE